MLRPVEPFIKGYPKITGVFDPLDRLPEELYSRGLGMRLPALVKIIAELFETLMAILHALSHRSVLLK